MVGTQKLRAWKKPMSGSHTYSMAALTGGLTKLGAALMLVTLLANCAERSTIAPEVPKISGPKLLTLEAPVAAWADAMEQRLRREGFDVRKVRGAYQPEISTDLPARRPDTTRYILVLEGEVDAGQEHFCEDGGIAFKTLTAALIDTRNFKPVFRLSQSGYSGTCLFASGSLLTRIATTTRKAWSP